MTSNHISTVRQHLLDTLADLRDKERPMDLDRAKAVATVAGVLVDTARAEVDYLRVVQGVESSFLDQDPKGGKTIEAAGQNGILSITRHSIRG